MGAHQDRSLAHFLLEQKQLKMYIDALFGLVARNDAEWYRREKSFWDAGWVSGRESL